MDKTKAKNDFNPPTMRDKIEFIAVWSIPHSALWIASWVIFNFYENASYGSFSDPRAFATFTFLFTLIATYPQQRAIEEFSKQPARGWPLVSALGAALSCFVFALVYSKVSSQHWFISALALLMPTALVQTAWLKSRMRAVWLWLLANLISVPLFIMPFKQGGHWSLAVFTALLLGALQGVIQAVVMHHMTIMENSQVTQ